MTPAYLNSQPSPFPLEFMNEDQHHRLFSPKPQVGSSSSSSLSSPIFFYPTQDQGGYNHGELQHLNHQQEADKYVSRGRLFDHSTQENERENDLKLSIWKKEDRIENQNSESSSTTTTIGSSVKWMSSKMRLMQKMMNNDPTTTHAEIPTNTILHKFGDQKQLPSSSPLETDNSTSNYNSFNNNAIRVCADCNTTKTPLWRSGPRGPKSLCNACGIRQRKARRAMAAAAAAAANGTIIATDHHKPSMKKSNKVQQLKDKKSSSNAGYVAKHKKRCKLVAPSCGRKKLCFEDFTISLSKNSTFQQVFPQDEKDAAILLMALSYGLAHG